MIIRDRLSMALTDEFGVTAEITDQATLDELGLDSLAVVELLDTMEKKLDIRLADDEMNKTTTISAAIDILSARMGGAGAPTTMSSVERRSTS